jgi:hypothetical protein
MNTSQRRMVKMYLILDSSSAILVPNTATLTCTLYSKIPWYPKLLFQRENALASFLVTQPRPSQVMIKHDFLL